MTTPPNDELCINTIRFLAIDAVEQANSGHPGAPMGAAAIAYSLWDKVLKHNPVDPQWPDRDRFVLSAGHASALLYALLHLTGYDLSLDELKRFRQWGSKTPGHPEYGHVPGVEATTGPLGQGFANGVGMAIAESFLAARYNRPEHAIIDHYTYALVSDGDLQEGVSAEAASLAGNLGLGKLIYLYDDNDISIEGDTGITFSEDVAGRFAAYGWQVVGPVDGFDVAAVSGALREARADMEHPSLIICRTIIGYGSPNKAGTGSAHGEPLGAEETRLTREKLGWPYTEPFTVPPEALEHFRAAGERGRRAQQEWQDRLEEYRRAFPEEAAKLEMELKGELPAGWDSEVTQLFHDPAKKMATREASGQVLNAIAKNICNLVGGSADLAPSTKTILKEYGHFSRADRCGNNLHFGIREHGMGAVANGLALHGGVIPYTATFLVFYDYMRPPVRLAAMMGIRTVFIFTHDSIGVGEDGPTHQAIEQVLGLRSVPNLVTLRPADATETAAAWRVAMEREHGPTVLVLTRQKLPVLDRVALAPADGVMHGAYVLRDSPKTPDVIIIGTGSELHLALEGADMLAKKGVAARVVSMPSWELFEAQPQEYRDTVLPPGITARVAIEAGSPIGWERYTGRQGAIIGINRFGASAPAETVYENLGITVAAVVEKALTVIGK
ncbi:transketolase [Chloroflexota bacterium]